MFDFLRDKVSKILNREKPVKKLPKKKPVPEKLKPLPEKPTVKKTKPKSKLKIFGADKDDLLWELELALLEADVAKPVAEKICEDLRESKEPDLKKALQKSLESILAAPSFNLVEMVKNSDKPFKIMFLGPNGAGKTLTLAKIAFLLKQNGLSSVFAASDTFRAASIEQLEEHACRLDMRVVKHTYGADPAAVAFDAVKSAQAKGINCVLIDTAGRQETNKNLIEELKKINRVVEPDLHIYVDEALAGNVLPERALAFKEAVGLDGVILTKMDAD
ncbi:MAG: signal recognition particle receptor subunit alpha, partial [Candidatus Diapherotrites archaeon]|nr:signal recognition particle receptor subunit alpha [Candidatus Diapherotrites archaeon]